MSQLFADELISTATRQTGLTDFGDGPAPEGLRQLVDSINANGESFIIPERLQRLKDRLVRLLENRLRYQEDLNENPEILEQELLPPTAIVSLPRTGTTKIQRMMSVTDSYQDLLYWQMFMPARITEAEDNGVAERIAVTRDYCDWLNKTVTGISQVHKFEAEVPEEDLFLNEFSLCAASLRNMNQAMAYGEWLVKEGLYPTYTYDFLYKALQYVQWQFYSDNPRPYLMKSPIHVGYESELARIFPQGINFIFTHREPSELVASLGSLLEKFLHIYYNQTMTKDEMGGAALAFFGQSLPMSFKWRDDNPSASTLDLGYKEICRDSVGTAKKIAEFTGVEMIDAQINAISKWDKQNQQHKEGKNKYTLEEFGLTIEQVNEAFAEYRGRYAEYL